MPDSVGLEVCLNRFSYFVYGISGGSDESVFAPGLSKPTLLAYVISTMCWLTLILLSLYFSAES